MAKDLLRTAGFSLRQQVEIFGRDGVSLTSLWRAVGRPEGHDPRAWTSLARPLIAGYARYLADLDPEATGPVVWTWTRDDAEPWRAGDLMSRGDIAHVYASYLDAVGDTLTASNLAATSRRGC